MAHVSGGEPRPTVGASGGIFGLLLAYVFGVWLHWLPTLGRVNLRIYDFSHAGTNFLLWESLAGQHPFWGGDLVDTSKRIQAGAPPLEELRPDLPEPLRRVVAEALTLNPQRRPSAGRAPRRSLEFPSSRSAARSATERKRFWTAASTLTSRS